MLRFIGGVRLLSDLLPTMLVGRDQAYLNQPWVSARTIRVDPTEVGVLDSGISDEAKEALYRKGYSAAIEFLRTWSWMEYLECFRGVSVRTWERTSAYPVIPASRSRRGPSRRRTPRGL